MYHVSSISCPHILRCRVSHPASFFAQSSDPFASQRDDEVSSLLCTDATSWRLLAALVAEVFSSVTPSPGLPISASLNLPRAYADP